MAKASDNLFPKVLLDMQTSSPAAPSDADWKLYAKPNGIYARSSNSEIGPFGASGGVATDTLWDAAGDLAVGTGANAAGRIAIGSNSTILTSNGTTATWAAPAAAGGFTHSYLGYNAVGGSTVTMTAYRQYWKQITPASNGLITGVGMYLKWAEDYLYQVAVMIASDTGADAPNLILGANYPAVSLDLSGASGTARDARWFTAPLTLYVTSGTKYWIGFQLYRNGGGSMAVTAYYDGSGSDYHVTPGAFYQGDPIWGNSGAIASTTNKYSIRADFIA